MFSFSSSEGFRNLTSQNIWDHLDKFFNLEKADSIEKSFLDDDDFDDNEAEFFLPIKDFSEALSVMDKGK